MIFDHYLRLEPRQPQYDLGRGIQAESGDPVWFLGRQWQMGEHQGEDAASPVRVDCWVTERPIDLHHGDPRWDPKVVPPEAIVESEPGDWWTIGRRIRYGFRFRPHVNADGLPETFFFRTPTTGAKEHGNELPAPYENFNGERVLDGWQLWLHRAELGIPAHDFPEIPGSEPEDLWQYERLVYSTEFVCGENTLKLERHAGGQIDWYSVSADDAFPPQLEPEESPDRIAMPTQLVYPGAPHDRYWQIEDHRVDVGGYPPDTAHFPTMLLVDAAASHGTEWFLFPVQSRIGHALTLERTRVVTSLGDAYLSNDHAGLRSPEDWSLFKVSGLDDNTLVLWPTALSPLQGGALEEVMIGADEYANLLWAVERRLNQRDVQTPSYQERTASNPNAHRQQAGVVNAAQREYAYTPARDGVPYWHPYVLREEGGWRRYAQARLADYAGPVAGLMDPEPTAHVLRDPKHGDQAPVHEIDASAVPSNGLQIERRWMLARDVQGNPVLWVQRQRRPLLAPPGRQLRFDVIEEQIEPGT